MKNVYLRIYFIKVETLEQLGNTVLFVYLKIALYFFFYK